jgi:hypothetical protein
MVTIDYIHWETLIGLLKANQLFATKNRLGWCGVGKWIKQLKKWYHDHCPRCEAMEDAAHVLCYEGMMQMMSGRSLCTFVCLWMELVQIEPEIVEMITISLCK